MILKLFEQITYLVRLILVSSLHVLAANGTTDSLCNSNNRPGPIVPRLAETVTCSCTYVTGQRPVIRYVTKWAGHPDVR